MRHALFAATGVVILIGTASIALAAPPQAGSAGGAVGPAAPEEADEATRTRARKIAEDGLRLFDEGRYAEALDHFERAGALVRAPTMALMAGRSLVRLGRLVEASERLLAATQMQLASDASDAFRKAQVDASKEREALLARIPNVVISLEGAAAGASVTLDGKLLGAATIGSAVRIDPGQHTVVVARDGTSKTERFQIQEGEQRRVVLSLELPPPATSGLKVAGITGLALGGAGLVVFAVAGGVALATKADLDASGCVEAKCPPGIDFSSYNTMLGVSGAGFYAGLALVGAGALMVGLAPSSPKKAGVQTWLGVGSAGVKVMF